MESEGSLPSSQETTNFEALCNISEQAGFYGEQLLGPRQTSKLKDHTKVSCRTISTDEFANY